MIIDQVLSVRLITAEGRVVEVNPTSSGDDLALFHALCGAGHGFGVITSLTLRIFPMSNLKLSAEGVWVRRLIFPAPAIETAATIFEKLQPVSSETAVALVFASAPPTAPKPGAPMIILTVTYYGPSAEAETAFPVLFDEAIVSKAIVAQTAPTPLGKLNDALAHFDAHGDLKDTYSAGLTKTQPETILAAFEKWLDFTTQYADGKRTTLILTSYNPKKQIEISNTPEGKARYFGGRDRRFNVFIFSCSETESTDSAAAVFAKEIKELYRSGSSEAELPRTLLNNIISETTPDELFSNDQVEELKRLVGVWDPSGLFWRPLA